jgi:hypothetical protein
MITGPALASVVPLANQLFASSDVSRLMFVGNMEAVATLSFLSFSPVGEKVPEGRMRGYLGK